jgi:uncharacterized protein
MKKESTDTRAGQLLRRARLRAAASQTEMAARAGVPQSTISAYESGARQPTLPMLSKLLEATGTELLITTGPLPERLAALTGPTGLLLRRHRQLIAEAAARYGFANVRVRGAVSEGVERPGEVVEILVDANAGSTLTGSLNLATDLEELIGVSVKVSVSQPVSDKKRTGAAAREVAL